MPPKQLDYWRAMTVVLLSRRYPYNRVWIEDPRNEIISKLVHDLLAALAPLRNQRSEQRCQERLEAITKVIAAFGLRAFGEINALEAYWPQPISGTVVVFPGLRQRRVDTGRTIIIREASME